VRSVFEDQRLTLADGVQRLEEAGIDYMLTGSVSMIRFAMARMTNDIDIVVELGPHDARRIIDAFDKDYCVPIEKVEGAIRQRSIFNVLSNETLIKIDLAIKKDTAFHRHAFSQRERATIWDVDLWAIQRDDLIVSKLYWAKDSHSEMQTRDVAGIMLNGYDHDYVSSWVEQLGVTELFLKCIKLTEKRDD
jgi:hypothetical protein